jgi:hypothetical protein
MLTPKKIHLFMTLTYKESEDGVYCWNFYEKNQIYDTSLLAAGSKFIDDRYADETFWIDFNPDEESLTIKARLKSIFDVSVTSLEKSTNDLLHFSGVDQQFITAMNKERITLVQQYPGKKSEIEQRIFDLEEKLKSYRD